MTHLESLAVMLVDPPSKGESDARAQAQTHLANCSECWETLELLHELATGDLPAEVALARAAYDCADVRDNLGDIVGLSAAAARAAHPAVARHLGWCLSCRLQLAELVMVERDMGAGVFGEPIVGSAWRVVLGRTGDEIRELAGTILARVRAGMVMMRSVPAGVTLVAEPLPAAMRGTATTPARAQGMVVALDGNRGTIELTIRPTTARRLDLDLLLVSNTPERLGASLRLVRADGEELVAARPVTPQELASFRDLAPGRYVLGLSTSPEIRIPLVIEEDG